MGERHSNVHEKCLRKWEGSAAAQPWLFFFSFCRSKEAVLACRGRELLLQVFFLGITQLAGLALVTVAVDSTYFFLNTKASSVRTRALMEAVLRRVANTKSHRICCV